MVKNPIKYSLIERLYIMSRPPVRFNNNEKSAIIVIWKAVPNRYNGRWVNTYLRKKDFSLPMI